MILRRVALRVILAVFVVVCFTAQGRGQATQDSTQIVDSLRVGLEPGKDGLKSPVLYEAEDSVRIDIKAKKVYLYKKAIVTYEDMKLEADYIEVSFETSDIQANGIPDSSGKIVGKPIFTTEGKPYHADSMWYNFKTKKGVSVGVVTFEDNAPVRGRKVLKDSNDNLYIRDAVYTTCTAEEPHFWIAAKKFKVVPEKQVISGPANLVIAGVNTPLVLPFGFFPIQQKRSRGLVIGSFDQQDRWGYGLRDFGYYTPINDYMDLLVTGDIYLRGSFGFSLKSNYKKRYKYNGLVLFRFNRYFEGERETPEEAIVDNYRIEWVYNRDRKARPGRSFTANVKYISKDQQRYSSTDINEIIATTANSSVAYSRPFANKRVFLTLNARVDQDLSTGNMDMELPQMNINVQRLQPFKNLGGSKNKNKALRNIGITYSSAFRNSISVNQDSIVRRSGRTLELHPDFLASVRNGIKHSASFSTSFSVLKYFNFSPDVSLTDFWYFKTIEKSWESDSLVQRDVSGFSRAAAYSGGISINTAIFGIKEFKKLGPIKAVRHTIQPTLGMRWSPDYQKMTSSGYRYVQTDTSGTISPYSIYEDGIYRGPSGSANGALRLDVNNILEMKVLKPVAGDPSRDTLVRAKVLERFNIGGDYNFLADSMKLSAINFAGFTTLFKVVSLNFNAQLDPYSFVYNDSTKSYNSIDKFAISEGRLGQLTSGLISASTSLDPNTFKKDKRGGEEEHFGNRMAYFNDFSIPWGLRLNYSNRFSKRIGETEATTDQTLNVSGNVKLTKYWKIGFQTGYNFSTKEPSITSLDFGRDLHCWVFNFHWVPLGTYRQFNFELRVKANKLKDLKIKRRDAWQNTNF